MRDSHMVRIPGLLTDRVLVDSAYTFAEVDKRNSWLVGKVRGWLLALGVIKPHFTEISSVQMHTADMKGVVDAVLAQRRGVIAAYAGEVIEVVVGPEQMGLLAEEVAPRRLHYNAEVRSMGGGCFFMGLEIRVVPWFDGVLVLP